MISFACKCGKNLKVGPEAAGKKVRCPGCGQIMSVPTRDPAGLDQPTITTAGNVEPSHAGGAPNSSPSAQDATQGLEDGGNNSRGQTSNQTFSADGTFLLASLGGYRIVRELGKGGMGAVFEAEDVTLKRRLALKVMKPEIATNELSRERFVREARTAASVDSDYICPIYQVGEDNGVPFIAMPFLKGKPLDRIVKQGVRLPVDEIVRIARQVAEGLSDAHEMGLIHRDIKPANIWLETQRAGPPRARILDFGLARTLDDDVQITKSGVILGTPAYMSPEQAHGDKNVDARSDLFSLGCVLYALCTGTLPFKGETTMGILMALATKDPGPVHEIAPATPLALSKLIMRLLEKKPADRPQSARDVIDELDSIHRTLPTPSPSASAAPPASQDAEVANEGQNENFQAENLQDDNLQDDNLQDVGANANYPAALAGRQEESRTAHLSQNATTQMGTGEVTTAASSVPRKSSPSKVVGIVVAVCLLALLVLGGGFYYLATNNGTIEIQSDVPGIRLALLKGGREIDVLETASNNSSNHSRPLTAGTYTVRLKDDNDNLEIVAPDTFNITRGGTHVVVVRKTRGSIAQGKDRNGPNKARKKQGFIDKKGKLPKAEPKQPPKVPPAFTNSIGMEFVRVPSGKAWLGGGGGDPGDKLVEFPRDYYLGAHEVTHQQWREIMKTSPSHFSRTGPGKDLVKDSTDKDLEQFPVEMVSWLEAQEFIARLNAREKQPGWIYRLPTEQEWEYACRGGPVPKAESTFHFYFDKPTDEFLPAQANVGNHLMRPSKVGSFAPNALGLYDMHGNVWEWCEDGLPDNRRILRGAGWQDLPKSAQAASHLVHDQTSSFFSAGLRVARVPQPGAPGNQAKN